MKKVEGRELKARLGRYLKRVRAVAVNLVTDRGTQVVRLIPTDAAGSSSATLEDLWAQMEAEGNLRRTVKPVASFNPVRAKGKPASRIILEESR